MVLGGSGPLLGASWADLEASWGVLGPLGAVLGLLEVILSPLPLLPALEEPGPNLCQPHWLILNFEFRGRFVDKMALLAATC